MSSSSEISGVLLMTETSDLMSCIFSPRVFGCIISVAVSQRRNAAKWRNLRVESSSSVEKASMQLWMRVVMSRIEFGVNRTFPAECARAFEMTLYSVVERAVAPQSCDGARRIIPRRTAGLTLPPMTRCDFLAGRATIMPPFTVMEGDPSSNSQVREPLRT